MKMEMEKYARDNLMFSEEGIPMLSDETIEKLTGVPKKEFNANADKMIKCKHDVTPHFIRITKSVRCEKIDRRVVSVSYYEIIGITIILGRFYKLKHIKTLNILSKLHDDVYRLEAYNAKFTN